MSKVLLVDWLGRGGIAQCSASWAIELANAGVDVVIVTRAGRELAEQFPEVIVAGGGMRPLSAHMAVVRAAANAVRERRPDVVVVQNFVVAPLETPLHRAVMEARIRSVLVVHDHRLHSPLAGTRAGLRRFVRETDTVLTHSRYVAEGLRTYSKRSDIAVVPLPVQIGMVGERPLPPITPRQPSAAIHFGVVKRRYKGTALAAELARDGVPGWRFTLMGNGLSASIPAAQCVRGFVEASVLVEAVRNSTAAILPYRMATQSGAVVLAQSLGTVPVATSVGGLPEQIEDGVTGRLLPPRAEVATWRRVLAELGDEGLAADMSHRAQQSAWNRHAEFRRIIAELAGTSLPVPA